MPTSGSITVAGLDPHRERERCVYVVDVKIEDVVRRIHAGEGRGSPA